MELIRTSLNPSSKQQGRVLIAAVILLILSTGGLIALSVVLLSNLNTMADNLNTVIATTNLLADSSYNNLQSLVAATTGANDDVYFSCVIAATLYNRMFSIVDIAGISIGVGALGLEPLFSPMKENSCCPTGMDCERIYTIVMEHWKQAQNKDSLAYQSDYYSNKKFQYLHLPNDFY
eukprot:Nk52_evm3s369 gene=Nk52_evmTU3s369